MRVDGNIGGSIGGTGGAGLAGICDRRGRITSQAQDAHRPYKLPKSIIVVDELPKTSTGKIQKNVVRDKFAGRYST